MTKDDLTTRLRAIVAEHMDVPPEKVTLDANFEADLAGDSLDAIEIIIAAEDEFDIEINDETSEKIKDFGQLVDVVAKMLAVPA